MNETENRLKISALQDRVRELEVDVSLARAACLRPCGKSAERAQSEFDSRIKAIKGRQRKLQLKAMNFDGRDEIMYAPGGVQTIRPQGSQPVEVLVDQASAGALELQRRALILGGKMPFFDFNHEHRSPSFYPTLFTWRPGGPNPGVYALGVWTREGKSAVKGKKYLSFSPECAIDRDHKPARIVCWAGWADHAVMGGLTNTPAWRGIVIPSISR